MLFKNYPTITYELAGRSLTLLDIFKSVSFVNVEDNRAFIDYYLSEKETPDMVSLKLYGRPDLSWLILLINNVADFQNEWYESDAKFKQNIENKYGGFAFYLSTLPDLQVGDVMVKVTEISGGEATGITASVYHHIADFDKTLRKIRAIDGYSGLTGFTAGDNVLFARKQENGTVIPIIFENNEEEPESVNYATILKKEKYTESVKYFYTKNGPANIVISPYKKGITGSTIPANTLYSNPGDTLTANNFAFTNLYKYGACGGVEGLYFENMVEGEFSRYNSRQKIKVLKKEYLVPVLDKIKEAILSDKVGSRFKVTIYE